MTPPSPPPGPAERGSPTSQVIWRRYDFPPAHLRSLILFGRGVHAPLPSFVLAEALRGCGEAASQAWNI